MPLALVTGASRGIGAATALELAREGFDLVVTYRSSESQAVAVADRCRAEGRQVEVVALDLGANDVEQTVAAGLKTWGVPDALVNNAGVAKDGMFAMMSASSWDEVIKTNLTGAYAVSKPIVRQMLRRRSGCIVNLSSVTGQRGNAGQVNYCASKAGLIGMTKALALELAPRDIRVNAVAPGLIKTDMLADVDDEKIISHVPLGRAGVPEDVAGVVAFLCSDKAAYITGQVIGVNGGLYT